MEMRRWYAKTRSEDMAGVVVRANRPMRNGQVSIPEGAILKIEGKKKGLALIGLPCETCGVQPRIDRVEPEAVEIMTGIPFGVKETKVYECAHCGRQFRDVWAAAAHEPTCARSPLGRRSTE